MMETVKKNFFFFIIILTVIVLATTMWVEKHYLLLSFLMVFLSLIPFYLGFERKKLRAEEVVVIAVLAAIAAVSRLPFMSLPGVQPTSFVIIVSGLVLGPEVGFMVGSTSALVSNFFLGQGPWTPWQMFGWGIMGLTAGLLRNSKWMKSRTGQGAFGFAWGFVFGWIMNLWFVLGFFDAISWKVFFSAYAASFYFDLAHALSNVFFITLFSRQWQKILGRVKIKYGLLKPAKGESFVK